MEASHLRTNDKVGLWNPTPAPPHTHTHREMLLSGKKVVNKWEASKHAGMKNYSQQKAPKNRCATITPLRKRDSRYCF